MYDDHVSAWKCLMLADEVHIHPSRTAAASATDIGSHLCMIEGKVQRASYSGLQHSSELWTLIGDNSFNRSKLNFHEQSPCTKKLSLQLGMERQFVHIRWCWSSSLSTTFDVFVKLRFNLGINILSFINSF